MCGRQFQCCEEVKDIAQISKVSLTRNDGVSDSSVYLIVVVISCPGGKQNCTVLLEIYNLELLSCSQGREWLIPRGGEMQNLVWVGDLQNKKNVGFMYNKRILKFIPISPISHIYWKIIFAHKQSGNLKKSIKNKQTRLAVDRVKLAVWLAVVGCGWVWLGVAGCGWVWLGVVGSG